MNESAEIKNCGYKDCSNTILANSEFRYCEVCRSLVLRNQVTILLDPTSPIMERCDMIFDNMVHLMRPDEILNAVHKIEWIYLELQKTLKSNELEVYRRTKFTDAVNEVTKDRSKPKAPKAERKRESKKDKLSKLLGGDEAARSIMGEDFSDL